MVQADMGGKNFGNHTQWVGRVTVHTNYPPYLLEAWGDGFYKQAWWGDGGWNINRWVRSGTNICGAYTQYPGSWRDIACIHISV
jgi:hypothetical protein